MDGGRLAAAFFFSTALLYLAGIMVGTAEARTRTFVIANNCKYTVWPGFLSNAGVAPLSTTGFALAAGQGQSLAIPDSWSGRMWGRTGCVFDADGRGNCTTADCGNQLQCSGAGAVPPATLAEFTLNGASGQDFYDVSLVDGYNLPMLLVATDAAGGACNPTGCITDLNRSCPKELQLDSAEDGQNTVAACRSACEAFGSAQYCCSGAYASPSTCRPSSYSQLFKSACPRAYSYAFDDSTSTFTCVQADYSITFCPSVAMATSVSKSSSPSTPAPAGSTESATSPLDVTRESETSTDSSAASASSVKLITALLPLVSLTLFRH